MQNNSGFSLVEILIALGIVGILAMFTVPKLLATKSPIASGSQKYAAQEVAYAVASAFQVYKLSSTNIPASFGIKDLTPYMNYVKRDTAAQIVDFRPGLGNLTCSDDANAYCLKMHTGGILLFWSTDTLGDTGSSNAIPFIYDADATRYTNSAQGSEKAVEFWLYADGRVRSWRNMDTGTTYKSDGVWAGPFTPDADKDPDWFSWN